MISFQASCIRSKYNVLPRTWASLRPVNVFSRSSSLSAIHRGLRNSEKARPQGFKKDSLNTSGSNRWEKPSFTMKKGKKNITDKGPGPKSRAARFNDPNESFGKDSWVYKLKQGERRSSTPKSTSYASRDAGLSRDQFMKDFNSSPSSTRTSFTRAPSTRAPSTREPSAWEPKRREARDFPQSKPIRESPRPPQRPYKPYKPAESSRPWDGRGSQRGRKTNALREARAKPDFRRPSSDFEPPPQRQRREENERPAPRASTSTEHGPVRIPRTTAASQFLYGYSVVEAALKQTRRKLYKLYIYDGDNRQDASRNIGLERKASQAGIPVTKVKDSAGLRMMEKMSEGRPHNGFVLEASPLPQVPIRSLGSLTEKPTRGFNIELGHQSAEEAQVNGTSNFVEYSLPPNRKPFVLILDGILDPGNLGAILRSAAFLGVNAIGITQGHSAPLTSVAVKASAGASEIMQLFSINSILDFLTKSREAGWAVYAAVAPTNRPKEGKNITLDKLDTYDPLSSEPTILIVGSEGEGLDKKTRRMADFEISIPNHSGSIMVDSLNASVATAILCSAFLKNQHSGGVFDKVLEAKGDASDQLW
ncbi:hypothetical protein F4774DRAFT_402470 [Daldinia eschscholtzii]|nr:hypothetical protein F4774DRAFT_402470 [Daldinia eschscholtzii]